MTSFVVSHGLYAVFLLMAIDAVFPAASELVMLVGGALATSAFAEHVRLGSHTLGKGVPTYIAIAAAGTIGYFAGSLVGWAAGRYGGRPLLERHARWFHLNQAKLARSERWFDRWGNLGVLIGRLTPLIRSFVSVAAGIFKMPLLPYSVLTLVGSAIWAFALAGAGWVAGSSYGSVDHDWRYVEVGVGLLVLATLGFAAIRFHSRRRKLNAA